MHEDVHLDVLGQSVEGMLDRLLDDNDAAGRVVRDAATIYVVPDMNPDGVFRGHVRTNATGVDLNRAW
jgi:murein tripeptide amidase MpaA